MWSRLFPTLAAMEPVKRWAALFVAILWIGLIGAIWQFIVYGGQAASMGY